MLLRFNERLKKLREIKNISQKDLASKMELTRSAVNSWEQGVSEPTAKNIVELAYIFNCTTDYLLSIDDKELIDISYISDEDKFIVHTIVDRIKKEYEK